MSTATIELSSTRRKLFDMLGENQMHYTDQLKNWFRKRCSKEDFDTAARKMLTPESVHLHNQFLLAVLNKCQTLVNISPSHSGILNKNQGDTLGQSNNPELLSPSKYDCNNGGADRLKKGKIKRKSKANRASLEHRFQPVSVSACAPEIGSGTVTTEEKSLQFCVRENTLPDIGLIHGRLLVAAWEEGLEGVEESAVKLALAAAEQQLRKLITALLQTRNSWLEREGLPHSVSTSAAPNPWLLNTQTKRKMLGRGGACTPSLQNEVGLAPTEREEHDRAEAEALYSSALAGGRDGRHGRQPLGLFDLLLALQADKAVLPSHTVYSMNVERILMRLHHKT